MNQPLTLHCSFCQAAPGEPCRTKTGRTTRPHADRQNMTPSLAAEQAPPVEQAGPVELSPAALEYNAIPLETKNATRATIEQVEQAASVELECRTLELEQHAARLSRASDAAGRAAYDADGLEIRIKHDYSNPNNVRDWTAAQARSAELRKLSIDAGRAASVAQYAAYLAGKTESDLAGELELKQAHAAIHENAGGPNDSRAIACRESIAAILEEQAARIDARERAANLLNDPIAWSVADAYNRTRAAGERKQAAYIAALRTARDAGYMPEERIQLANHAVDLDQEAQQDAADPPYLDPDTADRIARAGADVTRTYAACRDRGVEDSPRLALAMIQHAAEYGIDDRTAGGLLEQARAAYTPGPESEEQAPCSFCATHLDQYRAASVAAIEQAKQEDEAIDRYYQIRLAGHSHTHAIAVSQAPIGLDNVTPALYELLRRQPPIWSTEDRIRYARLDLETEHADRAVSVALLLEQAATAKMIPAEVKQARAAYGTPAALKNNPYQPPAGSRAADADQYQIRQFSRDSFILTLWSVAGEEQKAYRLVDKGRAIFEGTDYRPSPMHAWTTPQAAGGLLAFLTLAPGDTDQDYFNIYTADQIIWCASDRREDLQAIAEDYDKGIEEQAAMLDIAKPMIIAEPGTVSQGTQRDEDLIESFCAELERLQDPRAAEYRAEYETLKTQEDNAASYADILDAQAAIGLLINESLWDAMQDHAPADHSFGAHPGDGSDFGYWTNESED